MTVTFLFPQIFSKLEAAFFGKKRRRAKPYEIESNNQRKTDEITVSDNQNHERSR